jgi:hypothetical protein
VTRVVEFSVDDLVAGREDLTPELGFVGCGCGVLAQAVEEVDGAPRNDWDALNRWHLRHHGANHDEESR